MNAKLTWFYPCVRSEKLCSTDNQQQGYFQSGKKSTMIGRRIIV